MSKANDLAKMRESVRGAIHRRFGLELTDDDFEELRRNLAKIDAAEHAAWPDRPIISAREENVSKEIQALIDALTRYDQGTSVKLAGPVIDAARAVMRSAVTEGVTHVGIQTRRPGSYLLIDRELGHQWEIKNGHWARAENPVPLPDRRIITHTERKAANDG